MAHEVLRRLKALPGFGEQKAKIFLALLGKQFGVTPQGWRAAAGDYGKAGTHMSALDGTEHGSNAKDTNLQEGSRQEQGSQGGQGGFFFFFLSSLEGAGPGHVEGGQVPVSNPGDDASGRR